MLNIYLIYVSSTDIGDIDVVKKVYTSFGKATADIDNVIKQYTKERGVENLSRIVCKKDFSLKELNKDKTFPVGGYCFKKKRSSVTIYKKVLCEGRLWNSTEIELVGKIGLLPEINIPVDKRLIKIFQLALEEMEDETDIETTETDSEDEMDNYNYFDPSKIYNNYEHGQHVTFIHELKNKLETRRTSMNIEDPTPYIDSNLEKEIFIMELKNTKDLLRATTPPLRPKLGKVVAIPSVTIDSNSDTNADNDVSDNDSIWDESSSLVYSDSEDSIIILDKNILDRNETYGDILDKKMLDKNILDRNETYGDSEEMLNMVMDDDSYASANDIYEDANYPSEDIYEDITHDDSVTATTEEITDSDTENETESESKKETRLTTIETEMVDKQYKQIVDDILNMAGVNKFIPMDLEEYYKKYQDELEEYDSEEYEYQVIEYYENDINSDPVPRKYVDPQITENLSL